MSDDRPYNDVRLRLVQTAMVELMRPWPTSGHSLGTSSDEPRRYSERDAASLAVAYADAVIKEMRDAWKRNGDEVVKEPSNDALLQMWRNAGGEFHGPIIETATMPVEKLLPFLRALVRLESP